MPSGRFFPSAFGMYRRSTASADTCLRAARRRALRGNARPRLLDLGQRLGIDARRAAVPLHPPPCFPQDVTPVDAVVQRMEASSRLPLGRDPQSALQLSHFVDGLAPAGVVGTGLAGHALALTSLRRHRPPQGPFPPAALFVAAIVGTTIPSDSRCAALAFAFGLYEPRLPRPGLRRRVSRVPFLSLHACCAPYPAETRRAFSSGLVRSGRGLRRDMSGSALGL